MSVRKNARTEDKKKDNFIGKVMSFLNNLPRIIVKPFRNMWLELKKVTWPSRQDFINYTLIVLAFMVFMGVIIGLLDLGSSKLVSLMVG